MENTEGVVREKTEDWLVWRESGPVTAAVTWARRGTGAEGVYYCKGK